MKALKWIVGVAAALVVVGVLYFVLYGRNAALEQTVRTCHSDAAAAKSTDPARAAALEIECQQLEEYLAKTR